MSAVRNDKGEWVIPASKRPDGTWRKEKVIKEGYVPQEEIKAFETRAKTSAKTIPGLPPQSSSAHSKDSGGTKKSSKNSLNVSVPRPTSAFVSSASQSSSHLNLYEKERNPSDQSLLDLSKLNIMENSSFDSKEITSTPSNGNCAEDSENTVDKERKLKALRKKLRDIEDLLKKDPKSLSEDQIQKINRKPDIIEQISLLSAS